ncbi:MAG: hypothetical protein KAI72_03620, partial [Candidatus Pacebacteria bacterium]|nr:hypothetical protein [Candidatus Paceibacterota bacterium]
DSYGNPTAGTSVNFEVNSWPGGADGQAVLPGSCITLGNGQASTIFTFGNAAGEYKVTATSGTLTGSPITFTAMAFTPAALNKISGDGVSNTVTSTVDITAQLVNDSGFGIGGEDIVFSIIQYPDGATGQGVLPGSDTTDSNGDALTVLTLGNKIGNYVVRADYNSGILTADFTITATPASPYQVALTGPGSVGAGEVSTVFTVTVQDQYGNLSNVTADTLFSVQTTAGGTGGFYSDSLGANPITSRAISTGSNTAVFYYKDTSIGDPTITVTRVSGQDLSVVSDTLDISVIPGGLSYFAVTGDNSIMSAGESRVITVTAYDVENNPKTDLTQMNVYFSGANASPSPSQVIPTCSNNNSVDTAFGSVVLLEFTNGAATTELKVYDVETVHIKAMNDPTSPTVTTSDSQDLDIVVGHGSAKYLKFSADIPVPAGDFLAGIEFPLGELRAMDLYDNLCDGADVPANGYSGTKAVNYTLSGTADAPDGSAVDIWTNNVAFTAGVSTTVLNATLYRAQDTAITAAGSDLTGINIASNVITVSAGVISKLSFYEQPATSCLTNTNLVQQPVVAVADQYGNPVFAASDQITIS